MTVPATTLDQLVVDAGCCPDFVKLDVEGGELAVLRGGRTVLGRNRPDVAMEVSFEKYDTDYKACVELLLEFGYLPFALGANGALLTLDSAEIQQHGMTCRRDLGYLHGLDNLLFRHPTRQLH